MYYHVVIKTYSDATHEEKQINLSKQALLSQFIKPYENNSPLVIDGKIIKINDIRQIKIFSSRSRKDGREISILQNLGFSGSNSDFFDVTSDFVKWVPGYINKNSDKKIIEQRDQSNQIFIVHGHDEEMKLAVARTLEKLGLEPIILHEQLNQGRTTIEKFESYSENVSFAIVLLSPDDIGYKKDQSPRPSMFRARQNVILELGYFMGKLGRKNVFVLHRKESNFELPSDILGTLYTPFDPHNGWKLTLSNELKAAGYDIDFGKL